ncbi:MAG: winged helix-turn-helix domain-containing protein [Candidatus Bathyarchaeota archaeon]|jgi:predicted transcriptional regulator
MAEQSRKKKSTAQHNSEDGSKKTNILYKASLSFSQLERYLNALEKAGFDNREF